MVYCTALSQTEIARYFSDYYQPYCQTPLCELRSETLATYLQDLQNRFPNSFVYRQVGSSVQDRPIYLVEMGQGATPVLLWSQMHGDEPTATAALLDIFNFLLEHQDESLVQAIFNNLKIVAVPLLNPDGAAVNTRRNAQGLDINRDARDRATPEGRLLYQLKEQYQPAFAFNLHDQNGRLTTARTNQQVALALMAPPFDEQDSDSPGRTRAKQLVVYLAQALEPQIGGHIARYSDEYMPRAFGDAMQSWGVSTILIESGGWYANRDQFLQRLNFVAILTALSAIASKDYAQMDPGLYQTLPLNDKELFDLLISDVMVLDGTGIPPYKADVAINFNTEKGKQIGVIADMGDLHGFAALDTINGENCYLMPGMLALLPGNLLKQTDYKRQLNAWLSKGYTTILLIQPDDPRAAFHQWQKRIDDCGFPGEIGLAIELHRSLPTASDSLRVLGWLHQGAIGLLATDSLRRGLQLAEWVGKSAVVLPSKQRRNQLKGLDPIAIKALTSDRFQAWRFNQKGRIRIGQVADCVLFTTDTKGKLHVRQVLVKGVRIPDK
jgi:hypothetical protein